MRKKGVLLKWMCSLTIGMASLTIGGLNTSADEVSDSLADVGFLYGSYLYDTGQHQKNTLPITYPMREVNNYKIIDKSVSQIGDTIYEDGPALFIGTDILANETNVDQELKTIQFEKTLTESATATTTHSVGVGMEESVKFDFFIGEGSAKFTVNYNFTNTSSDTTTESIKYTLPSQTIKVPANAKYQVQCILETQKAKANVQLNLDILGNAKYAYNNTAPYTPLYESGANMVKLLNDQNPGPVVSWLDKEWEKWEYNNGKARYKNGKGTVSADYGTRMYLVVKDVTNTKARSDKEIARIPVTPIKKQI
ncbi:ETX/MTX2 family pore-forming toxin [Bacillus cereus]|uniref:ETX/MTX2 family pore-forming toxin n=1 Tax=Bacillus cereus TaxID=1396 RepID=UPI002405D929|nr:ETX/MTX2 family pore-forming toxin [Bacillus cereus]MED2874493.1 ETX/MTX2 family pore-forming toxin [Bacillus thuringiensis]MDF9507752.1 ETX/MTX2 family pore-forming toxin [Bacillus cereus]MDF9595196.1 ETX/MTX2 family pore-forming toxin [Bacillus cereus]MDF9608251.1 ETX/MTX2 family pore-forming toxin [Bacillus cereus]MDF9659824.1 ETX/MTX2 family pore-forming toxin [Bacillus cereus]